MSPQRNEAPGGARDCCPFHPSQAWNWRSIKQFFSNWGRWNHCFCVPIITLFPEAEAPTRGPGVQGTDNTSQPGQLGWPASHGPDLWPVHVCTLLSPTKQVSSPRQSLELRGGGDISQLTLWVSWRATPLDCGRDTFSSPLNVCQLLIPSWPKVTNCPQIKASCGSKGSYLGHIPGVLGQHCGQFPAWIGLSLHQFGLLSLAPGGPAQSLLTSLCLLNTMHCGNPLSMLHQQPKCQNLAHRVTNCLSHS